MRSLSAFPSRSRLPADCVLVLYNEKARNVVGGPPHVSSTRERLSKSWPQRIKAALALAGTFACIELDICAL